MRRTWFTSGEWNAICDRCGTKNKSTDLKQDWQGLMLCGKCWEPRHPQDLIRPIPEQQKLPWTRPEANDTYSLPQCTIATRSAYADLGTADCMLADNGNPAYYLDFVATYVCTIDGFRDEADIGTADCATVGHT